MILSRLYSDYLEFSRYHHNKSPDHFDMMVDKRISQFNRCVKENNKKFCIYRYSQPGPALVECPKNELFLRVFYQQFLLFQEVRLTTSIYIQFLTSWFQVFPNQTFVICYEEYSKEPEKIMNKVHQFLELSKKFIF